MTVTLKLAMSLDGRIATASGRSQWITGPKARARGHALRAAHDAVLVGIGTVLADDPRLTVRDASGRSPVPVVLDTHGRTPPGAALLRGDQRLTVLLGAAGSEVPGADNVRVRLRDGRIDVDAALATLAERGLASVLVEGGAAVARSFLDAGRVDRLITVFGGRWIPGGRAGLGGDGVEDLDALGGWVCERTYPIGGDVWVEWGRERPPSVPPPSTTLTASCVCGAVQIDVLGPLPPPDACHCATCRKVSGHYFASTDVRRDRVAIRGETHVRWFASSPSVRRGFCDTCGANLFWDPVGGDFLAVAMGLFDGATGTRLDRHIFVSEKGDYYDLADDLPKHPR